MEATSKTWEELFLEIANSGHLGFVIVVAIVSFALGVFLTWIYFTKLCNLQLQNKLSSIEDELELAKNERDEYKQKYEQLKRESSDIRDDLYVRFAQKADKADVALQSFVK